jgi:predicted DCC family thiol-disulfide oxidoreductase YuxK
VGKAAGAPTATLLYDGGCASCTRFARLVRRLDMRKRIRFVSMYDAEVEARLRPKVGAAYDQSFHLELAPGGRVVSGEGALEELAKLLPAAAPFGAVAFKLPGAKGVPAVLYRAFSAGRTCAQDTAERVGKD